jgi:hypothetical protein
MRRSVFFEKDEQAVLKGKKGHFGPLRGVVLKTNGQQAGHQDVGLKSRDITNFKAFSLVTVTPGTYLGIRRSRFFRFSRFS